MRSLTLVITNLIKISGLVLAIHTGFGSHPQVVVLALSGFMMAGAQLSETTILGVIDRFLGGPHQTPELIDAAGEHGDNGGDGHR